MEELFDEQLHGLVDPGVADHLKRTLGVLAELRDLDQAPRPEESMKSILLRSRTIGS